MALNYVLSLVVSPTSTNEYIIRIPRVTDGNIVPKNYYFCTSIINIEYGRVQQTRPFRRCQTQWF